jgi:hypothetical protein
LLQPQKVLQALLPLWEVLQKILAQRALLEKVPLEPLLCPSSHQERQGLEQGLVRGL